MTCCQHLLCLSVCGMKSPKKRGALLRSIYMLRALWRAVHITAEQVDTKITCKDGENMLAKYLNVFMF